MPNLLWIFAPRPKNVLERWEWPMAMYKGPNYRHAAYIACQAPFDEQKALHGLHMPVKVVILQYNHNLPNENPNEPRRQLYSEPFARLESAMAFTQNYLDQRKSWQPVIV